MTVSCDCGNEPLDSIKCDEHRLDSQEGICSLDLVMEQNLQIMNWGALLMFKAICDEGFSNVRNDRCRKCNFVKSSQDRSQAASNTNSKNLGIKIKIFMIKVCKSFTCACTDNCASRGGQQISEFQILICA